MGRVLLYQKLARLALVVALFGLFVCLWSMWEYEGYGKALVLQNADLSTGSKYYDWNRNQNPVMELAFLKQTEKCSSLNTGRPTGANTWADVNNALWTFQGTVDGCHENNHVKPGRCHSSNGKTVEAVDPISKNVNLWHKGHYCVARQNMDVTKGVEWLTADNSKCKAVKDVMTSQCSSCSCWHSEKGAAAAPACPVTGLVTHATQPTLGSWTGLATLVNTGVTGSAAGALETAAGAVHWQQNEAGENWLVNVHVSMNGLPCKEEGRWPAQSKQLRNNAYHLLTHRAHGCTEGGDDDRHTKVVGKQTEVSFLDQNKGALTLALALPGYRDSVVAGNGEAMLVGRYQIETKCSASCRGFRFGDVGKVEKAYAGMWREVRNVCIVTGVLSGVGLVLVVWLTMVKGADAKQSHYTLVLGWQLVVLTVVLVLLSLVISHSNRFSHHLHHARKALHDKCVADAGWSKVLRLYVEKTDLSSLHNWSCTLVGLTCLLWVVGVVGGVRTVRELGQSGEGENWENSQE